MYHNIIVTKPRGEHFSSDDLHSIREEIKNILQSSALFIDLRFLHGFYCTTNGKISTIRFFTKTNDTNSLKRRLSKLPFLINVTSPDSNSEKLISGRVFYQDSGFLVENCVLTEKCGTYSMKEDSLMIKEFWDTFHEVPNN